MRRPDNAVLASRADIFRALHLQNQIFVMPCAWDAFSAMVFERAGFACIGTTSGGVNWINGRRDYVYAVPRSEMLSAYGGITGAVSLPVSGDLEQGYGDSPSEVASTVEESIKHGMVGGSIEDQRVVPSNDAGNNGELYTLDDSVERLRAARQCADSAGIQYTLTARCEVYYTDCSNPFSVAVDRLNAYQAASADCLFVPGLNDLPGLKQLVKEVEGPISFGMGATPVPITVTQLEDIGIRRVSTGGGLTRATFALMNSAATAIIEDGTFGYLDSVLSEAEVNKILSK